MAVVRNPDFISPAASGALAAGMKGTPINLLPIIQTLAGFIPGVGGAISAGIGIAENIGAMASGHPAPNPMPQQLPSTVAQAAALASPIPNHIASLNAPTSSGASVGAVLQHVRGSRGGRRLRVRRTRVRRVRMRRSSRG